LDLTDTQWAVVGPLLPEPRLDRCEVLDGILWILRTGAQWADLPERYPPYQTCHRYFQQWCRDGTLTRVLHALARDLYKRGGIDMHLSTRRRQTQDGRPLRRYRRRWKIERLFAWLQNYRRLITRHEHHAENFLGFVHLGCICILLRYS